MAETSNRDKPHLFDMCFQFPEDEFDWEPDRDHPSECWDLFNSWLEYPEANLRCLATKMNQMKKL